MTAPSRGLGVSETMGKFRFVSVYPEAKACPVALRQTVFFTGSLTGTIFTSEI